VFEESVDGGMVGLSIQFTLGIIPPANRMIRMTRTFEDGRKN
jgi:hypothetical protein